MKFAMTNIAAGVILAAAATGAQAVAVTSLTIEEIGVVSGGLGTSAVASNLGGSFYFQATGVVPDGADTPYDFTSIGTPDGAIMPGTAQGNGAFATSFAYGAPFPAAEPNFQFRPNSCGGNQLGAGDACNAGGTLVLVLPITQGF